MVRLIILRVLDSYFRHRWLYFLPILMVLGAGIGYILSLKPTYKAEGVLYVQKETFLASLTAVRDNTTSWWISPAQATSSELRDLLQTEAFIRAIIQQTVLEDKMVDSESIGEFLEETRQSFWVQPLGENQILVGATHESPLTAYQLVNAVIEGYLIWNINAGRGESQVAQEFFSEVIETYSNNLDTARTAMRDYLLAHPEPIRGERSDVEQLEIARLQAAMDLAASRYSNALDKEESSRLAMAQVESDTRQTYFLIDAPKIPTEPESSLKDTAISLALSLVIGVVISGVGIVGSALLDRSFRFDVDIEHRLELPVLSSVPDVQPPRPGFWGRIFRRRRRKKDEFETEIVEIVGVSPVEASEHKKTIELDAPAVGDGRIREFTGSERKVVETLEDEGFEPFEEDSEIPEVINEVPIEASNGSNKESVESEAEPVVDPHEELVEGFLEAIREKSKK